MELRAVLHALAWVLYQRLPRVDPEFNQTAPRAESPELLDGMIFMHCQNFDDYDRAFGILVDQGLLVRLPEQPDPEFIAYKMILKAERLREHLEIVGVNDATDPDEMIGCFLDLGSKFGTYEFLNDAWGEPLPVGQTPTAAYPSYFDEALRALEAAGYCHITEKQVTWLPGISKIMEAEGLWGETAGNYR